MHFVCRLYKQLNYALLFVCNSKNSFVYARICLCFMSIDISFTTISLWKCLFASEYLPRVCSYKYVQFSKICKMLACSYLLVQRISRKFQQHSFFICVNSNIGNNFCYWNPKLSGQSPEVIFCNISILSWTNPVVLHVEIKVIVTVDKIHSNICVHKYW